MADTSHDNIETAVDEWGNLALPPIYDEGSNIRKLLKALLSEHDRIDSDLKDILDGRHLSTATGKELDRIGELGNVLRKDGESDDKYRARIRAKLTAGNSSATFDDIALFITTTLSVDPEGVTISTDFATSPTAVITEIDYDDLDGLQITDTEFSDIVATLVPAGHTTRVTATGTFELSSESYTPPSGTGLTDDSGTAGGTLSGDIN